MGPFWTWDRELFRAIHVGWHRDWLDPIMVLITSMGLGQVQAAILLPFLIAKKSRPIALQAAAAAIVAGLVRLLIAHAIDRPRPSNYRFSHPLENVYLQPSFPSGHGTTSFAIAFAICLALRGTARGRGRLIGWLAVLWACLVGMSRVYVGVHYPVDVLGGAALGLLVAVVLAYFSEARASKDDAPVPLG